MQTFTAADDRCTCTMIDPGVYHGDNMHPPEWEQDPWCLVHPYVAHIRQEFDQAKAAVERVRAALDLRTLTRAWMAFLGYEDHQIDKAESWRQPPEPWLHDDPPQYVLDIDTGAACLRLCVEAIEAALDGPGQ